jgi:hypothetical protein
MFGARLLLCGCVLSLACGDEWPASDDVHITEPRPGGQFSRGSNLEIRWKSRKGKVGKKVQLYLYRGSNFFKGIAANANNNGDFSWFIPPDVRRAARCCAAARRSPLRSLARPTDRADAPPSAAVQFRPYDYYKVAIAFVPAGGSGLNHEFAYSQFFSIVQPTEPPTPSPTPSPTPAPSAAAAAGQQGAAASGTSDPEQSALAALQRFMHNQQERTTAVAGLAGLVVAFSFCSVLRMLSANREKQQKEEDGAELAAVGEQYGLIAQQQNFNAYQVGSAGATTDV